MSRQRYPEEFKIEADKQMSEKGKPVADVAQRLGMSVHSFYAWIAEETAMTTPWPRAFSSFEAGANPTKDLRNA